MTVCHLRIGCLDPWVRTIYRVFKEQVYIFDPYADRSSVDENAQILFFWTPKDWTFMIGYYLLEVVHYREEDLAVVGFTRHK